MALEGIEFVDYVFDRYVYLGLTPDATEEEIAKIIKIRKAQNHPDAVARLDEELKKAAAAKWEMIEKCEAVLLTPEIRAAYDARLDEFKKNRPDRVMDHDAHFVFLDPSGVKVDVDFLLGTGTLDLKEKREQEKMLSGFDEKAFDRAKRFYDKDPADADSIAMYREALYQKLAYLEAMDKAQWAAAGILGEGGEASREELMDAGLLQKRIQQRIAEVKDEFIPQSITHQVTMGLLGYDKNPMLLLTQQGASADIAAVRDDSILQSKIDIAQRRFAELSGAIDAATAERAAVLEAIIDLAPHAFLHKNTPAAANIFLVHGEEGLEHSVVMVPVHVTRGDNGILKMKALGEYTGLTFAELQARDYSDTTLAVLIDAQLVAPHLQIGHAFKLVGKAFGEVYARKLEADRPLDEAEAGTSSTPTLG